MKKFYILFFIMLCFVDGTLRAESAFSGNVSTVDPRSGFNALRSPALMSFRRSNDCSLSYQYSYLTDYRADSDVKVGGAAFDSEIENEVIYNGIFSFSNVNHSGKNSFGIGITDGSDGQMRISSSDIELSNQLGTRFIEKTDEEILGFIAKLSYSYRIDSKEAFGIQLELAASDKSSDKNSKSYSSGLLVEDKDVESEQNRIAAGLVLGYFYTDKKYEFGAGFKTGRYGYENREYTFTNNYAPAENHAEISNYIVRDEGIGMIAGFSLKPEGRLSFAFEAGGVLPYTNEEKKCNEDSIDLDKKKNDVNVKYALILKGGATWRAGSYVTLGAGGSYLRYNAESMNADNVQEAFQRINIYQLTAGAEIKFAEDYNLLTGIGYSYTSAELKNETSSLTMALKPQSHNVSFIAGITMMY
ncbi:MAG TPA: hypothetical protein P5120_07270 [Spirochaetota bacterium]|nr:hypothetical protein [Spirochaetota bacterium]